MKRGFFIFLGMFMMVSTVEATNGNHLPNRYRVNYYSYNNAVNFIERGIEFFVFPNGEFDFDTYNYGVRINRNYRGQIRRVGNVFINYDRFGNVSRIGNVFMRYRRGRLVRVGNLRVNYNRWDEPIFTGYVRDNFYYDNSVRFNLNLGVVYDYNDRFFFRNNFRRNYTQFREDNNFYYYRARPNTTIGKRNQIIKRRKSNVRRSNSNLNNNRYRKAENSNNKRFNNNTNNRKKLDKKNLTKRNRNSSRDFIINKNKQEKRNKITSRRRSN